MVAHISTRKGCDRSEMIPAGYISTALTIAATAVVLPKKSRSTPMERAWRMLNPPATKVSAKQVLAKKKSQ